MIQHQHCKGLFQRRTIASGNTLRARIRSDGRLFAPMLPTTPPIVACPHCDQLFVFLHAEPIAQFDSYIGGLAFLGEPSAEDIAYRDEQKRLKGLYSNVPEYADLSSEQCIEYVNNSKLPSHEERVLRHFTMQVVNDFRHPSIIPQRYKDDPQSNINDQSIQCSDLKESERMNMKSLMRLLNGSTEDDALLAAEIYRELSQFEESKMVLDRDMHNGALAEQILIKCEEKDNAPFLYADKYTETDFEGLWMVRRYKPEDIKVAPISLDPPELKIANRSWYIKVLGMLCHNWALIDFNDEGSVTAYFFQDTPPEDRPAVIDSLEFTDHAAAVFALQSNGFELLKECPGPWMGQEPKGFFYDSRRPGKGIYSSGEYWS